ncbi:MAG: protein-glutamate O-methyltransferase CheR [Kofleriaceae bacterium]|nr:protein-glutamate O-methyltransferase CheR [Kofleriaceae bacterium]
MIPPPEDPVAPLTEQEFRLIQQLVMREAGIVLGEHKRAFVTNRLLRRVRDLGLPSFTAYYGHVTRVNRDELTQLLDAICVNETRFFREPDQFAFLDSTVFPELEDLAAAGLIPRRIRAWSAACSTGEEPYSLAMALRARFPKDAGWTLEVVATDLSTKVLEQAREAIFPLDRIGTIPPAFVRRFMLRGTGSMTGKAKVTSEIRELVTFSRMNLSHDTYPVHGTFDVILCRNVLIYFDAPGRNRVVTRLLTKLKPHGYLFLGHSETLSGFADHVQSAVPNVYRFRAPPKEVP